MPFFLTRPIVVCWCHHAFSMQTLCFKAKEAEVITVMAIVQAVVVNKNLFLINLPSKIKVK